MKRDPAIADLQPTLAGELVVLRPLREEDFDALYAVASDPRIWEQHPAPDRYQEPVFREFFRGAMDSQGAFLVSDAGTGEVIGSTRLVGLDLERSEVEIGWTFLARSRWGGRYNGEMKRLLLDHAFRFVRTVVFLIGPDNIRSQVAVQRIGARHAGTRQQADGRTSVVFAISGDTWAGVRGGAKSEERDARGGVVEAIWIKRAHRGKMDPVVEANAVAGQGLAGSVGRSRRRQVSLIDAAAWDACMAELGASVDPSARRANLMIRGIDLEQTRGRVLLVGDVRLQIGGELTPCERMDEALPGLQAAMRPAWRGGAFAQVLSDGVIRVGDSVRWEGGE